MVENHIMTKNLKSPRANRKEGETESLRTSLMQSLNYCGYPVVYRVFVPSSEAGTASLLPGCSLKLSRETTWACQSAA